MSSDKILPWYINSEDSDDEDEQIVDIYASQLQESYDFPPYPKKK